MILLALNYEHHLHHPNDSRSYTLFKYTRNQSLGFSALLCFCISYIWLISGLTNEAAITCLRRPSEGIAYRQ